MCSGAMYGTLPRSSPLRREDGGAVEVRLSLADSSLAASYFDRRFDPKETEEIRLYLYDGDDQSPRPVRPAGRSACG